MNYSVSPKLAKAFSIFGILLYLVFVSLTFLVFKSHIAILKFDPIKGSTTQIILSSTCLVV